MWRGTLHSWSTAKVLPKTGGIRKTLSVGLKSGVLRVPGGGEPLLGTRRGYKLFGGSQGSPLASEILTPERNKTSRLVGLVGISHARQCAPTPLSMCIVIG